MNRLLVVRNGQSRFFVRHALISVCALLVVRQRCRIGPEHRSRIEGEPTIQHSRYSSRGFAEHEEQLLKEHCLPKTMCCDFSKAARPSHR